MSLSRKTHPVISSKTHFAFLNCRAVLQNVLNRLSINRTIANGPSLLLQTYTFNLHMLTLATNE